MATYDAGIVTAYGAAVEGGYTGTYEQFCAQQANYAQTAADVEQAKEDAETAAQSAEDSAEDAEDSATLSESYAVGGTGTRTGEDTDNAKYYAELSAHTGVKVTDGDDEYILSLAVQQSHMIASLAQIS